MQIQQSYVPQRNSSYLIYLHELITKISEFLITKELSYLVVVTGGAELGVGIGNPKSSRSWSEISRTGSSHSDKLEKFSALKNWLELNKSWSLRRVLFKAKEGLLLVVEWRRASGKVSIIFFKSSWLWAGQLRQECEQCSRFLFSYPFSSIGVT